jgi:LacI family transcriptional regulator
MKRARRILVAIDSSLKLGREVIQGITEYVENHRGWDCHFNIFSRWAPDALARVDAADGLILDTGYRTVAYESLKIPVVEVGYHPGNKLPHVRPDFTALGRMAADHLMSRGFQRFAYYAFNGSMPAYEEVGRAFKGVIQPLRYPCQWFQIPEDGGQRTWPMLRSHIRKWVKRIEKPVAVFTMGDGMARELAMACAEEKVEVPREVALLGTSNDELRCLQCKPYLSSIDLGGRQLGYEAARLLERLIRKNTKRPESVTVPPVRVIMRHSTDVVAVADEHVVAACRYIEERLSEGVSVKEMLEALHVGRRTMELAFRKCLGRTIHEEIVRLQIQRASVLLETSRFNLDQIAAKCGMHYRTNLANFFKKYTGITPLEYRRRHQQREL